MEMAGLILIGIGVNTFMNGVWLILFNSQNKKINDLSDEIKKLISN